MNVLLLNGLKIGELTYSLISYLYIIGIAQGLLLSFNFFEKGRRITQYQWLGGLILVATLMIVGSWISYEGVQDSYELPFLLASGSLFLMGPLLYLFVKASLEENVTRSNRLKEAIHFIPALFFFLLIIFFANLQGEEVAKEAFNQDYELKANSANIILPLAKILHLLVYTVFAIRSIIRNKNGKKQLLKSFVVSYLVIQLIVWILFTMAIFYDAGLFQLADFLIGLVIVLAIYVLGYLSVKQSDILPETFTNAIKKRYKTTGLTTGESEQYYTQLITHLEKNESFINPDLSLKLLAFEVGISSHQLSQIINENSNYNFSGLISHYRVNKFKALLGNPKFKDYTLIAIAFEAGFNNKNSFNQAFKKETGMAPSQYRKEIIY